MADGGMLNGRKWEIVVGVVVVVFQTLLVVFGAEVRYSVRDLNARTHQLELFAAAGDRWTKADALSQERALGETLKEFANDLEQIRVSMSTKAEVSNIPPPWFREMVTEVVTSVRDLDRRIARLEVRLEEGAK